MKANILNLDLTEKIEASAIKPLKGMLVSIFKDASGSDCTNDGVTSKATRAILVGEGIPEIFEADNEKYPTLKLVKRILWGEKHYYAEPVYEMGRGNVGYMFGGNFVYTSDSRFHEAVGGAPLAVHDRSETIAQYNSNFN